MNDSRSLDLEVEDRSEAKRYCRKLAAGHYENFTVVLPLLSGRRKQDLANIYAYCRWVDDLADRSLPPDEILPDLDRFESMLEATLESNPPAHPVFLALVETIERCELEAQPFRDLISAFRQDQQKNRYENFAELVDYSQRSAAPVGRLVLSCFDADDELTRHYADSTSIALQLVNFWADVKLDLELDRIYIPAEDMRRFGVDGQVLRKKRPTDSFRELMAFEVERARDWLRVGWNLVDLVDFPLSLAVELFNAGGWAVLDLIESERYDVLSGRLSLSGYDKFRLGIRGVWRNLVGRSTPPG